MTGAAVCPSCRRADYVWPPGCTDPFHGLSTVEGRLAALEQRVKALLNNLYEHGTRLDRLERPVDSRDAIAWEMGHAAALRGDAVQTNPFRKPEKRGAL